MKMLLCGTCGHFWISFVVNSHCHRCGETIRLREVGVMEVEELFRTADMITRMVQSQTGREAAFDAKSLTQSATNSQESVKHSELVKAGVNYILPPDKSSITCLLCGHTSFNPNDVINRRCANCHTLHVNQNPT